MRTGIDAGHGGQDRANVGPTGYVEADGVLDIALRFQNLLLTQPGHTVLMSRTGDETVSLTDRVKRTSPADAFISIHTNAFPPDPSVRGYEVFYSVKDPESKRLAECIERALRGLGIPSRGIKTRLLGDGTGQDYYYVLRAHQAPAVLVEAGFHTNPEEEALLKTPEFRQKVANCLFSGLMTFYGQEQTLGIPVMYRGNVIAMAVMEDNRAVLKSVLVRPMYEAAGFTVDWRGNYIQLERDEKSLQAVYNELAKLMEVIKNELQ